MDPFINYKNYHKNIYNKIIHIIFVPLIYITYLSLLNNKISFLINFFYSFVYFFYGIDYYSFKVVIWMQFLYLVVTFMRSFNFLFLISINIVSWIFQLIGHKYFEKNTPAFVDSFKESFIWAPYLIFSEINSFLMNKKIRTYFDNTKIHYKTVIPNNIYNIEDKENIKKKQKKKIIIYFNGLFQYNNIYKNIDKKINNFIKIYCKIVPGIDYDLNLITNEIKLYLENNYNNSEYEYIIIGYSFGATIGLNLAFKLENIKRIILFAPSGFYSYTITEKIIMFFGKIGFNIFKNNKWTILSKYPTYDNKLTWNDITNKINYNKIKIILAKNDFIHNFKETIPNRIIDCNHFNLLNNI